MDQYSSGLAGQMLDTSSSQSVPQGSMPPQQPLSQAHSQQPDEHQQSQQQQQQHLMGNGGGTESNLMGGGGAIQNHMTSLNYNSNAGLPQGTMNGSSLPHPGQVPLLVGTTPFQQHVNALQQGMSNAVAGTQGLGEANHPGLQSPQTQQQHQQLSDQQQQMNGANPSLLQQQQQQHQTLPKPNMPAHPPHMKGQQTPSPTDEQDHLQTQQQQQQQQESSGQQQQQDGNQFQNAAMNAMAGLNQNAIMAAAMGSNMGFNLQQLQQLQVAQQLMAAGLPPNLAFADMQQPGASIMSNPLMLAGLANPMMMSQFGGLGSMGGTNPMAALGMAAANAGANPAMGFLGMNGMAQTNQSTSTNPIIAAGLGAMKADAKTNAPVAPTVTKPNQADWAEPFAGKGKKEPPFPLKLHQILSNPEFQECICWNPHGRSWRILKPPVFEQLVIPLYFRHAKYASFMRQVNGWGFSRIVSGNDHNSYFHELFLRDYPQACLKMKRIRKGEKAPTEDSDGDDKQIHKISEDLREQEPSMKPEHAFQGLVEESPKKEESGHGSMLPRSAGGVADNNSAQTLTSLGLSTGNTGLATAAPGYSALASLQGSLQNGGPSNGSGLSNVHANNGNGPMSQSQFQPNDTSGMTSPQTNAPNPPMNNSGIPPPVSTGGSETTAPSLDNSAFMKLQEALQSGSLMQQQSQQSGQAPSSAALNLTNLNFLQGPMGGTLAAQLQAATQAPSRSDDLGHDGSMPGQTGVDVGQHTPKLPESNEISADV